MSEFHKGKLPRETVLDTLESTWERIRMMMFNQTLSFEDIVKTLPSSWTVLQISTVNSSPFSRFKKTHKDTSLREGSPNLCLIRLCNDGTPAQIRTVLNKDKSGVVPFLLELQNIKKVNRTVCL